MAGAPGLVGENPAVELATNDLLKTADWAAERWAAFPAQRWDATHTTVEWTPRRTLDHLVDAMLLYSAYVATRARHASRRPGTATRRPLRARWWTPSDQASSYSRDCSTASGTTSVFTIPREWLIAADGSAWLVRRSSFIPRMRLAAAIRQRNLFPSRLRMQWSIVSSHGPPETATAGNASSGQPVEPRSVDGRPNPPIGGGSQRHWPTGTANHVAAPHRRSGDRTRLRRPPHDFSDRPLAPFSST